jgi:hypothetical protein
MPDPTVPNRRSPDETPPAGLRACSWLTLGVEVDHDGSADALAEHVSAEIRATLARWGLGVGCTWVEDTRTVLPGDDLSPSLPVIGQSSGASGERRRAGVVTRA